MSPHLWWPDDHASASGPPRRPRFLPRRAPFPVGSGSASGAGEGTATGAGAATALFGACDQAQSWTGAGVAAARFAAIAAAHDGGNAPGATMAGSGSSKFGSNSAAISLSGCT
ncbi:hypothetical protein, partial [Rhodococcus koreensis]